MCGDLGGDMWGGGCQGNKKPYQASNELQVYLAGLRGWLFGQRYCVAISNPALLPV